VGAYALFLISIVYAIGFVGNFIVPKSIDSGPAGPFGTSIFIDVILLALFALQHSVMARQSFKRWLTEVVPPAIERSTYVLCASAVLLVLYWQWQPIPTPVWTVRNAFGAAALQAISLAGWALVVASTFMISHFELFGLKQVFARLFDWPEPRTEFRTPALYRMVRHPIYLGFLLAFWATPAMTVGHLLFALATTGYILIGIQLEERDLVQTFGDRYRIYRDQVGMLVPKLWHKAPTSPPSVATGAD
jgi:protein-S-isoprenylcysteine O-methyltransferase Ste14